MRLPQQWRPGIQRAIADCSHARRPAGGRGETLYDPPMPAARDASTPVQDATPPARPLVELVELGWERIQLRLALRGAAQGGGDPNWVRAGEEGGTMPPTWAATDEALRLRFNVMLGPAQMPM